MGDDRLKVYQMTDCTIHYKTSYRLEPAYLRRELTETSIHDLPKHTIAESAEVLPRIIIPQLAPYRNQNKRAPRRSKTTHLLKADNLLFSNANFLPSLPAFRPGFRTVPSMSSTSIPSYAKHREYASHNKDTPCLASAGSIIAWGKGCGVQRLGA